MNSRTLTLKRDADVAWICRFALDDARLTWKAKGLLLYLVNMVPGTTVNWSDIGDHSADGKDAVNGARKELAALGYLSETASGVHVTDGNAENPPMKVPIEHEPLRKTRKRTPLTARPGKVGKPATSSTAIAGNPQKAEPTVAHVPGESSVMSITEGDIHCAHGSAHTHAQGTGDNLFGFPSDDKATRMRNSLLTLDVCKNLFAEMRVLNVDIEYYFNSILEWSDKKHRQLRTSDGWASTIRGAMRRDKDAGKLRMVGGSKNELSSVDALNYLNL